MPGRYRVQFYTERDDGTKEWCVCDFAREAETGKSSIIEDKNRNRIWTDKQAAQRFANAMNRLDAEE